MKNRRLVINLVASIFAFVVQLGINFFLSPFLVERLGDEAYGFIGLANNFVSYATILTVALNSMAGRFIAIEIHKGNLKKANEYFSSVAIANIIMSVIALIASGVMILNLDKIINIPQNLDTDVKITFTLVFINFILTLLSTAYNVATFVKNRLDLSSIAKIVANVIMVLVLLLLFVLLQPKIYYIAIGTVISTILLLLANRCFTKKLMKEVKLNYHNFSFCAIKTILSSGIWNSINNLSTALLTGLDLLIANLFVSPAAMGVLAIAKTIPTAVVSLLSTIGSTFTPQFTYLYSQNNIKELIKETKFSIKVLSLIMVVPLAGVIVFGKELFTLWYSSKTPEEIWQIQILSILALAPNLFSSYIYSLYSINTVTNKLKLPVMVTLTLSIISTVLVFVLLKTTKLGIYAVAGVSSVILILRVLIFVPVYAAKNLNAKWYTFYGALFKAILSSVIIVLLYIGIRKMISINTWLGLIIVAGVAGMIGYCLNFLIILNKEEKIKVRNLIYKLIKRERKKVA